LYGTFDSSKPLAQTDEAIAQSTNINFVLYTRLKLLGYDVGSYDGSYSVMMKESMAKFQISHQIHHPNHPKLGTYTDKTKEVMEQIDRQVLARLVALSE
jgi:hypothetical protein